MAKKYFDSEAVKSNNVKRGKYYKDGKFSTPDKELHPDNKDGKEYMLGWAEYFYSLYMKNKSWMGHSYSDIDTMRAYMEGNQPVDQYKDFVYGKTKEDKVATINSQGIDTGGAPSNDKSDRTAWVNIDEKPISIGPKIVTKLLEIANSMYYEMAVNAVDSMSVNSEEMAKARLWYKKENMKWIQSQKAMLGIKEEEPEFMPLNVNELELYKNSGGFKVPHALALELLIKHSFDVSDWSREVFEKVLKDLISNRYALIREFFDKEDKRVKVKYVDIKYGGLQFSRDYSFKDSEYGYELEEWPISKVRQKLNLSHEEAAGLAYSYSGVYGNPPNTQWDTYGFWNDSTGSTGFDFYRVPVFRCEWIDVDNEKYYKHKTKSGREFVKPVTKNKDTSKLEVYDNRIRYVREATWIPGTQYLCDYGKVEYMIRDNPKKPRISYRGIRLPVPALFEQIRPLLNGLTLAYWKTQQAIAIAISNGIAVDVGALKNIAIGKDKSWDVTKVLAYYRQQAILLHKKTNPMNFTSGGSSSPVTPLMTRMYENIAAQFDIMNRFMQTIESISGISLVSMGETPEPRVGKYNMQVALQGTNQIIGSVIRAATDLQADVSINIGYKIRSLTRTNKSIENSYTDVIGKAKMRSILKAEKNNVKYGFKIEARDVSEMKVFIEEILAASMKASYTGGAETGLLDPSEVILVRDMLEQKQNMRMISLTLGYMLRKKGKAKELQEMKRIELQGEQTRKAEQEKQRYIQDDRQFEMAKLQKEFESDFMVKWGYTPSDAMKRAAATPPGAQGAPEQGHPEQGAPPQGAPGAPAPQPEAEQVTI